MWGGAAKVHDSQSTAYNASQVTRCWVNTKTGATAAAVARLLRQKKTSSSTIDLVRAALSAEQTCTPPKTLKPLLNAGNHAHAVPHAMHRACARTAVGMGAEGLLLHTRAAVSMIDCGPLAGAALLRRLSRAHVQPRSVVCTRGCRTPYTHAACATAAKPSSAHGLVVLWCPQNPAHTPP